MPTGTNSQPSPGLTSLLERLLTKRSGVPLRLPQQKKTGKRSQQITYHPMMYVNE